ncbi:glucagon-like peptide 1 receptor isoform 2-T2 [Geothlypis trichas]
MRDSPGAGSLRSLVQLAWLCLFSSMPHGGAKVLEKTFEEWLRYRDECLRRMASEPYPAGLFCNRTFDMYACWPDGSPGTTVNVSCPFYLPWFEKVKQGLVSRRCGTDGQWVTVNGSQPWRDYSQCEDELEVTAEEEGARRLMVSFKVLYTVGYSLSLLTLISALLVLTACRNLRCTRNYIHANLFASFGLRATSVMVKDALLERRWGVELVQVADWEALLSHEAALGCRAAQVLMQYCILANHYWFLVEAVYLYKLLIGAVFSEKNYYRLYLYLGWGTPVVFVVPWIAAKYLKENAECWALNENMAYWWIIRIPILLASLVGNSCQPWVCLDSSSSAPGSWPWEASSRGQEAELACKDQPKAQGVQQTADPWFWGFMKEAGVLNPRERGWGWLLLLCSWNFGMAEGEEGQQQPWQHRGCHLLLGECHRQGGGAGLCVPLPCLPLPDQPAHLHADPQGDPGQAPGQPEGLRRLQAEAGQSHPDPHPPLWDPRGRFHLRHGRANHGHPALRQGVLHPLPQLLPGLPGGCAVLLCQQGGEV